MNLALGLIETKGLVGALEAADAMAKAANIKILGKEKVSSGLMVIKIEGEVAAVKSAVDAGSVAAQRVGQLISAHVIPRPAEQVSLIVTNSKAKQQEIKKTEQLESFTKPIVQIEKELPAKEKTKKVQTKKQKKALVQKKVTVEKTIAKVISKKKVQPTKKKVVKIRSVKNSSNRLPTITELVTLNVHTLRKIARSSDKFPIKGRDISKANRSLLLDFFKKIK